MQRNGKAKKKGFGVRSRMDGRPGKVVGLKVTKSHPLDKYEPQTLAVNLAQQLQASVNYERDAKTFAERANIERQKAIEMQEVIDQVEERRRNGLPPDAKKSRMDPLETYDPMALRTQKSQHERNALMFDQKAQDYTAKAEKERKEADKTQVLIRKVNARIKERAKEG